MVLKRLIIAVLALCLGGCLPRLAVRRLDKQTPVAVAYVLDPDHGAGVRAVPEALKARLAEVLAARNLQVREVPFASLAAGFDAARDSRLRTQQVAAAAGDAPYVLLVETRAAFFSQISGRYRWTVYARVTASRPHADPVSDELSLPAMLDFDHERAPEALTVTAPVIAERAGALFDSFLSAPAPAVPPAAPVPPEPAAPVAPSP
ncbi:MAG: hypothetical protein ACYC8T_28370 [Myxococcaceae bacterium]